MKKNVKVLILREKKNEKKFLKGDFRGKMGQKTDKIKGRKVMVLEKVAPENPFGKKNGKKTE